MSLFYPLQQQHTNNRRMPRAKADAKPRGRMTAYAFFVQTCREEHKKKHPDESVVFAEFSKKCAERWKVSSNYCLVILQLSAFWKLDACNKCLFFN